MSKNVPQRSILTANRLGDGAVIFLDFEGAWSEAIDEALVALSPDEVRALEDRGAYDSAHNLVVEPYLVEIREVAGRIEPIRYRERVRAGGPTILEDVPGYTQPFPSPRPSRGEGQGKGQLHTTTHVSAPLPIEVDGEREHAAEAA